MENLPEVNPEEKPNHPEAPASITYSLISPMGYPLLFTVRGNNAKDLLVKALTMETYLYNNDFKPDLRGKSFPPKKEVEIVPDRKCPTCGADLVYFESQGKKHIKCSTQKFDFKTKTKSGCEFIEWTK